MDELFLQILNNALTVSYLIIAIIVVRALAKKMPKWIVCLFWILVALKLVFPIQIESRLSLIPSANPLHSDIAMDRNPEFDSGIESLDSLVNPVFEKHLTPSEIASANPLQIYLYMGKVLWLVGLLLMIGYALLSYMLLELDKQEAKKINDALSATEWRLLDSSVDGVWTTKATFQVLEGTKVRKNEQLSKPLFGKYFLS